MKQIAKMIFKESEFKNFIAMQVKISMGKFPPNYLLVKHSTGTSNINKGKYSSWTDYWQKNMSEPLTPDKNVCPCCKRKIIENESNYFVIGHVEDVNSHEKYLLPLCNDCNVKMKKWSFLANKERLRPIPTNL